MESYTELWRAMGTYGETTLYITGMLLFMSYGELRRATESYSKLWGPLGKKPYMKHWTKLLSNKPRATESYGELWRAMGT